MTGRVASEAGGWWRLSRGSVAAGSSTRVFGSSGAVRTEYSVIYLNMHGLHRLKFQEDQVPFAVCSDFFIHVANLKCDITMILRTLNCRRVSLSPLRVMRKHGPCDSLVLISRHDTL